MHAIDRPFTGYSSAISGAITVIVAGWFGLAFALSLAGLLVGA